MHSLETAILQVFKAKPDKEFCTTELVKEVFLNRQEKPYREPSKEESQTEKRRKAMLHRKLLYHLNKLVDDGVIKTTRMQAKGEKCFALALEEGELIIGKGHKKIIISKTPSKTTPVEMYEQKGIVKKIGEPNWESNVNSILIECKAIKDLNKAYSTIIDVFNNVNDVVGLNNFEALAEVSDIESLLKFVEGIEEQTKNYQKRVNLLIDAQKIGNEEKFCEFAGAFSEIAPSGIDIIFNLDLKEFGNKRAMFEKIIRSFSEKTIKVNIKNNLQSKSPFMVGNAGVYCFNEDEWESYQKKEKPNIKGVVCSQTSITIDFTRFFKDTKSSSEFRKLVVNSLKAIVMANSQQRRKTKEYFKYMEDLSRDNPKEFFSLARSYIRFWNYDLEKEPELARDLLKSCSEMAKQFCRTQETVFQSCGIPSRCRVVFSSGFKKQDSKSLSERVYKKTTLTKPEDIYNEGMKKRIKEREHMFQVFNGGDRVRFFRSGSSKPKDIVIEINTILSSFNIPFFCYDFANLSGRVKLTDFFN